MSCPHLDDHLRTDLDAGTSAFLRRHAENCPDCARRLEVRRSAYAVLAADVPPMSPRAQAAQWARLEGAIAAPLSERRWWLPLSAGLIAAGLVGVVLLNAAKPELAPKPDPSPVVLGDARSDVNIGKGMRLEIDGLRLVALEPAVIRFPNGPEGRLVFLASGELDVTVSAAPPAWVIETPTDAIRLLGTQMVISAHEPPPPPPPAPVAAALAPPAVEKAPPSISRAPTPAPAPAPTPAPKVGGPGHLPPRVDLYEAPPSFAEPTAAQTAAAKQDLREARALIGRDNDRAIELAERVIESQAASPTEVAALMVAADGWRRRGDLLQAVSYYGLAINHVKGAPYAEEAYLRRATLYFELERYGEALQTLEEAKTSFGKRGGLVPERVALMARAQLVSRSADAAATTLLEYGGHDRVLDEIKVEVAETLLDGQSLSLVATVNPGRFTERIRQVRGQVEQRQFRR